VHTVWVFGDQLNRSIGALADARPDTHRVLLVESRSKLASRPWHVQRAHFYLASMRRFAGELRDAGFEVDLRRSSTMTAGLAAHRAEHHPEDVIATAPNSRAARDLNARLGVTTVPTNQFLTSHETFTAWATGRKRLKMEDFYREQRRRLGYLMDGDEPVGGTWNLDAENRRPPPRDGSRPWPSPPTETLDALDAEVIADLPASCRGAPPAGWWATTRAGALARLAHFVDNVLPMFGPHEDSMLSDNWHLAHSMLSPYLNNGLLLPGEVCDAVQARFDRGDVPLSSAEGFIRQVIGWREYVWGLYWHWPAEYASMNTLGADRPVPVAFGDPALTRMRCVRSCASDVHERGWAHHIQRLMVLGNLSLSAGVSPRALTAWMWESFVDGAEWVMVPNVVGMSQHADGGMMATKPYLSGGAYINKMSDYCKGCDYSPDRRTGEDACPFTTLYWDFLDRHSDRLVRNPRVAAQVRAAGKRPDLDAIRDRAAAVRAMLDDGRL
jgi:deoxyribodipyrimidine photolyase-related protein